MTSALCPVCRVVVAVPLSDPAGTCRDCLAQLRSTAAASEPLGPKRIDEDAASTSRASSNGQHLAAVARNLGWADESAARGDYADALGWIGVVEALGDPIPREYASKRRSWRAALDS